MLADVIDHLRCPHCRLALRAVEGALRCETGHSFDVARHGYVSLFDGRAARGDTAAMVAARTRFLEAGHMDPLYEAVAAACGDAGGCIVDLGAGTGRCLARVLGGGASGGAAPGRDAPTAGRADSADGVRVGLALDSSKYALRRAARAHPRIGAVACDAWRPLPVRDATAALVLSVFAPRDAGEVARILAPDGTVVGVTPTPRHLAELVDALGLLTVDEGKPERLDEKLAPALAPVDRRTLEWDLSLSRADCLAAAAMGPSAWHRADLDAATTSLPEPFATRASVTISRYRRAGA